jgi:hypothetical protein
MRQDGTRRSFLAGAGVIALGGAGVAAGAAARGSAAPHAAATDSRYRVAVVNAVHDGGRVSVAGDARALRLEGVPAGWQPAVGDKVAVGPSLDTGGVTAQQLIRGMAYSGSAAQLVPGRRLGGPAGPRMTEATIVPAPLAALQRKGDQAVRSLHLAIAEREAQDSMLRIVGVHEA